jgi:DNA modification methylase
MVLIFREVMRVLKPSGLLFLNIGDTYANTGVGNSGKQGGGPAAAKEAIDGRPRNPENHVRMNGTIKPVKRTLSGLKPKDLVMMPARVALALQADGWYLRSDIIWHKSNPMPESVDDRPTKAHEYIYQLSKSQQYFYDAEAVREPITGGTHSRGSNLQKKVAEPGSGIKNNSSFAAAISRDLNLSTRNRRDVWTISTDSFTGAHFATFPEALVEPCIQSGTSARGNCPKCGEPWIRVVEKRGGAIGASYHDHSDDLGQGMSQKKRMAIDSKTPNEMGETYQRLDCGFVPGCRCYGNPELPEYIDGQGFDSYQENQRIKTERLRVIEMCRQYETVVPVVLDPFMGSGTTGLVALKLKRQFVGFELKPEYAAMANKRVFRGCRPLGDFCEPGVEEKNITG